jgi:hypothetical protein
MRTTCEPHFWSAVLVVVSTHLDGAEDPEDERLHNGEGGSADAEHEVDAEVLADLGVAAGLGVSLSPVLEPIASSWRLS